MQKKAMDLKLELQDSIGMAFCYNNLGIIYMMKSEYDKGLELRIKSLETKLILGDSIVARINLPLSIIKSLRAAAFL